MSVRRVKTTSGTYFTLALPLGWSARAGAPRPSSPLRVSRKRMTALIGSIPDQMGPCEAESEHAREREHQRCHLTRASASGYKRRRGAPLDGGQEKSGGNVVVCRRAAAAFRRHQALRFPLCLLIDKNFHKQARTPA